jgi:2-polyprenyl-3-methyl-5-hydroxy-6-metoxy-1,4-benzoquinol methylase
MEVSEAIQFVPCPLCRHDDYEHLSAHNLFRVVRCRHCGLVYLNPRPSDAVLADIYSPAYFQSGPTYQDYLATHQRFASVFARLFHKRLVNIRRFLPLHARVLEIGCAYGFWLKYLANRGYQAEGVEISAEAAAYARDKLGLNVHQGTLLTANLPSHSYDAIFMLDILEHLPHPEQELAEVRRLLKPDGILYVQCPFELYHWEKWLQAWQEGKHVGGIAPDAIPAHLMFFVPRTLEMLLRREDFHTVARPAGNYSEIRRMMYPPKIIGRNPLVTAFNWIYYRCGLERLARDMALALGQGSGIICIAKTVQR